LNTKVLIIDDEADFCHFIKKNLMQSGMFDVVVATNGKDGIKMAKEERPDMPGDDVAEGAENKIGNNYILPKPVRTKTLIETIMNILSKIST